MVDTPGPGFEPEFDDVIDDSPEPDDLIKHYVPPGPVSQAYLSDLTATCFLMGPVGGGKTTTNAFKRVADGAQQGVGRDGWIRDRCLILRKTWRTAKRTVLSSWNDWFPRYYPGSTWTGGEDRPALHTLHFADPNRKVKVELQSEFAGLDDNRIEEILAGSPYSRIWLEEADQFSADVLAKCEERVGRYPNLSSLADGQRRTKQVIGSLNAPDKANYLFDLFVENPKPARKLICQPAGLLVEWNTDGTVLKYQKNPAAENVAMLDDDYYTSKANQWEEWRLRRFVLNEWGYSRDGLPVFVSEFREALHVAKKIIDPDRNMPLIIGIDGSTAGLRPAAVFLQPTSHGQLRLIKTYAPGHGVGAARFAEGVLGIMETEFRGCNVEVWADPASQFGADKEGGQLAFADTVALILGLAVRIPAGGSNEIGMRLDAVRNELKRVIEGEVRGLTISPDPSNKIVINGLASAYCFKKRPPLAPTQWEATPLKNEYSDPMDALGYGILGWRRTMPNTVGRQGQAGWQANAAKTGFSASARQSSPWSRRQIGDFDVTKL